MHAGSSQPRLTQKCAVLEFSLLSEQYNEYIKAQWKDAEDTEAEGRAQTFTSSKRDQLPHSERAYLNEGRTSLCIH